MYHQPPLLELPLDQHKIRRASTESNYTLRTSARLPGIPYQPQMKSSLVNLGLYQMKDVTKCYIDKGLITALVERWRPETNTFHLPVGECTVTLEDVSCLWGLPITGMAIAGHTDDNWSQLIVDCLGHEVYNGYEDSDDDFFFKKVEKEGTEDEKITISKHYMRLKWLKDRFVANLTPASDQETINRYTRAYCMDLFGSVMFHDSVASGVPIMYLQFLENLGHRNVDYNWGGAVLACLYSELSRACRKSAESINGPLLLLQMWCWTRFPIGRPRPKNDLPFGMGAAVERLSFGAKWTQPHEWEGNPIRGTKQFRNQFDRLNANVVNWNPYTDYYSMLPSRGLRDFQLFTCRVWCIHFWEVEIQFPDRVVRQFGLFQTIPPNAPVPFQQLEELRSYTRASGLTNDGHSVDWSEYFADYIAKQPICLVEQNQYDLTRYDEYMHWFFYNGMPSVFLNQNNEEILNQPVQVPEENVGDLGYVSDAIIAARTRFRLIKTTAQGIAMVKTPGQKAYGLQLLRFSRDFLQDIGLAALFRAMLRRAELPSDIYDIDVSDDYPDQVPNEPDVTVPPTTAEDVMNGSYHSLSQIMVNGCNVGDNEGSSRAGQSSAGTSRAGRGQRVRNKTKRFSHSNYPNPSGREAGP